MNYSRAPDVEKLAKEIIDEHFSDLKELIAGGDVKVAYLWRPEAQAAGEGRVIAGQCVHLDDRNYALHGHDFAIVIARDVWEGVAVAPGLDPEYRRALVHHELCHISLKYDDEGELKRDEASGRVVAGCRRHDIEDFEDVVTIYGAWHAELRRFLGAFRGREESPIVEDAGTPE